MPRLISEITEITTGLGMLGYPGVEAALTDRPPELIDLDDDVWARLYEAWAERRHEADFLGAFANGAAFLEANDALRGRRPVRIEWRGPHQSPGDEVVPADLRIDHVYLVSCKYLSKVMWNTAPGNLFDRSLIGAHGKRGESDWFAAVAPAEHQRLYDLVVRHHGPPEPGPSGALPMRARDLTAGQRRELRVLVPRDWHPECAEAYRTMCRVVSVRSAERWREHLESAREQRSMLWRLLRIGSAPYYVLGSARGRSLRLRVASPWDWNRAVELRSFEIDGDGEGQARVAWRAEVRDRDTRAVAAIEGHVEVRWSHGRFSAPPEAKVYLDTPHHVVPGYWPLS